MPWFSADLHIHSCVSPCGSLDSSPSAIVAAAKTAGLDLVGLSDHNCALNTPAFAECCSRVGLQGIFGMEVTSAEEAHCLCLFSSPEAALDFGKIVFDRLLKVPNDPAKWGDQVWVNADDEIEGEVEELLVSATSIELGELNRLVHTHGGLFIPAHVERTAFSLMSQLGFVPPGNYDALETYRAPTNLRTVRLKPHRETWIPPPDNSNFPVPESPPPLFTELPALICNSDAHYIEDIGSKRFTFWGAGSQPSFDDLKNALHHGWVQRIFG